MVELAVRQKPLHQVDVLLAGSAGAAERAALVLRDRIRTCLRRLARLVQVTRTLCVGVGGRQGKGWEGWRGMGGGGDQTRSQDFRMWIVDSVKSVLRLLYYVCCYFNIYCSWIHLVHHCISFAKLNNL